jgi:glycosyltransferase involved in cell wall biosynthesis
VRILHAIHDFLPRHHAGSEIYALHLCRELAARHHVSILCAEYDPRRRHGHLTWRVVEDLQVIEVVNNWLCGSFVETYRPPLIRDRIAQVMRAIQPDVVHVHNLLNLSFDLPSLAAKHGAPVVATLHDYTLVCPSGGQRIHQSERYVCHSIDSARCVRCFRESPFYTQASFGRLAAVAQGSSLPGRVAAALSAVAGRFPTLGGSLARAAARVPHMSLTPHDIDDRLAAAREVFHQIDTFVAPSASIASEFERLGVERPKIRVSDYGFVPLRRLPRNGAHGPLRIGYVGTLVWHKGVHVLMEAVRDLPSQSYELKIFGDTNVFPEYVDDLRTRATGLPVVFKGAFHFDRASEVYQEIDVLVVPSLWLENSPLVIHEAFMAGVPVVGARIGGIADLIEEGRNGLLYEPSSPAALSTRLRGLIEAPDVLRQLAAGTHTGPPVKTIAQDAREWEAIYADVVSRRAVPRPVM